MGKYEKTTLTNFDKEKSSIQISAKENSKAYEVH